MRQQYLLIEDIEDVGRSGEVIAVKPGFARNFLIPQKKAVLASEHTLRMQERLQAERSQKAAVDKKHAIELATKIESKTLEIAVKVDPEGNMYGSVSQMDVVHLFEKEGIQIDKKSVILPKQHIKQLGVHALTLKLKEDVVCNYTLNVVSDVIPEKV
jgi:large subunit ribosomal protein L9